MAACRRRQHFPRKRRDSGQSRQSSECWEGMWATGTEGRWLLEPKHQGRDEVPDGCGRILSGQGLWSPRKCWCGRGAWERGPTGAAYEGAGCLWAKLAEPWLQCSQGMERVGKRPVLWLLPRIPCLQQPDPPGLVLGPVPICPRFLCSFVVRHVMCTQRGQLTPTPWVGGWCWRPV